MTQAAATGVTAARGSIYRYATTGAQLRGRVLQYASTHLPSEAQYRWRLSLLYRLSWSGC
jgi:hypothetical protein